jgi:hypothetical protein
MLLQHWKLHEKLSVLDILSMVYSKMVPLNTWGQPDTPEDRNWQNKDWNK